MTEGRNIFLEVHLPNATTWFYATLVLAVALFFQFRRPFCLRNLDVLLLFLVMLPLLYLREAQETRRLLPDLWEPRGVQVTLLLEYGCNVTRGPSMVGPVGLLTALPPPGETYAKSYRGVWRAYLFLLIGTACFLLRCFVDLVLRRRSHFKPNLSVGGLLWFVVALFVVMTLKTYLPELEPRPHADSRGLLLNELTQPFWEAALALTAHGLVVLGLIYVGARHFQDFSLGVAVAVYYLLLPYTALHLAHLHHVAPAVLCLAAVAWYRHAGVAGICLGLATGVSYFPILLVPVWASFYFRRGMKRFLLGFFSVIVLLLALLLLLKGWQGAMQSAWQRAEWQAWTFTARPQAESLWTEVTGHGAYRVPLFLAHLLLMVGSVFWPSPKNLGHVLAWSVALILGVQFWYADAGGIYVLWYLPLLVLMVFRPTLSECMPPTTPPPSRFLSLLRKATNWLRRPRES